MSSSAAAREDTRPPNNKLRFIRNAANAPFPSNVSETIRRTRAEIVPRPCLLLDHAPAVQKFVIDSHTQKLRQGTISFLRNIKSGSSPDRTSRSNNGSVQSSLTPSWLCIR